MFWTPTEQLTPAYLVRLVVNLSTSKSISDVIARARCIRFIHEWLRTIASIGNNPQRPFLDQTYVLSILVLDETQNLEMDSRLAADLIRELIRLELIASNQNTESAIGQRRDDLTTRLVKYVSNSFSFVRMSRTHTSTTTLAWLRTIRIWIEVAARCNHLQQVYDDGPLRDIVIPKFLTCLRNVRRVEISSEIHMAFRILLGNGPRPYMRDWWMIMMTTKM